MTYSGPNLPKKLDSVHRYTRPVRTMIGLHRLDRNSLVLDLRSLSRVRQWVEKVITPYDEPTDRAQFDVAKNGHAIIARVKLKGVLTDVAPHFDAIRATVHSNTLSVLAGGEVAVQAAYQDYSRSDLEHAE